MAKPKGIIKISDDRIDLLVGLVVDGKPVVIYSLTKNIEGIIENGEIVNPAILTQTLAEIKVIKDDEAQLKLTLPEVTLILPPFGFQVYENTKSTGVVSTQSTIETIDVQNVLSLVKKDRIPGENELIDIIPDNFILEDGSMFTTPPLGAKSQTLTIRAKLHVLPKKMVKEYTECVEAAGMHVRRLVVEPYGSSEYIKIDPTLPDSYVLINCESAYTTISLIGKNCPFASTFIYQGKKDLITCLADEFKIQNHDASRLLSNFGFKTDKLKFEPTIITGVLSDDTNVNYKASDISKIISDFFMDYFSGVKNAINVMLKDYPETVKKLPLVFTGKFNKINGFKDFSAEVFSDHSDIYFVKPKVMGARESKWTSLLGSVLIGFANKGSLSEQKAKIGKVERVK